MLGSVGCGAEAEEEGAEEQEPATDGKEKGWGAGDDRGQNFLVLEYGNSI
jgi:hypothetical protein